MRQPPYLPFLAGALSLAPGLKPIPPGTWLDPDTEAESWLSEKRALMQERRADVFGAVRGSEAAMREAADAVLAAAPGAAEGNWETPLEHAASAVSDDLCLLMRDGEGFWRLEAGSLCAPTFWRLSEKIGQPLSGLHDPVPGANPGMVGRIHRMFDALRPGQVLERFNWTVQPGAERFTPSQAPFKTRAAHMGPADALDALWLRVERQTISKLPETGAVIFTIRVAIDPLRAALAGAGHAAAFRAAWEGIDPVLAEYKGWPHYQDLVMAALAEAGIGG
ncbi:MAG: heme-dependent oxidative N-demethylase family protein [Hyphomonas sp.]